MEIILAGYNVDADVLSELVGTSGREDTTPETISAAYARISRDPRPVSELRRAAREEVEKARKSNRNIIFGMGHHSVAEHAVFNFDIIGVSRLAIEEIERFRLCSYTEKSQRYIALEDEFVIPDEICGSHLEKLFVTTVNEQQAFYRESFDVLKDKARSSRGRERSLSEDEKIMEAMAKEDARYIMPLSTAGQLGETINARNLELLLRRFASHELSEVREIGRRMYACVADVAPSVVIFTDANDYDQKTYPALRDLSGEFAESAVLPEDDPVRLVDFTTDADLVLVTSLIHSASGMSYSRCRKLAEELPQEKRLDLVKTACRFMELYDPVLREFEYVHLTYELLVSASCFAQLKRHRMTTITTQDYDPELGITVPQSILDCDMGEQFTSVAQKTEETYYAILDNIPSAAAYILTNGHRRRVLLDVNARELYHISRLREDNTAQWEIRSIAGRMVQLAKKTMPLVMLLAGGKDSYPAVYEELYGRPPRVTRPELPS